MVMLIKNLKRELKFNGNTGIILGSGLGHLANELKDKILGRKLQNSKISGMKLKE